MILTVLCMVHSLSPRAQAQNRPWDRDGDRDRNDGPREGVCFFTDSDFRGERYCVENNAGQRNIGALNDRISSIRIYGGAEVTVFQDSNFRGDRQTFREDAPHLGDWNDRISSFQVSPRRQMGTQPGRPIDRPFEGRREREPRSGACFYMDDGFRGDRFCMEAGDSQREVSGRYNDKISSIEVFGGARVFVYEHSGFGGDSRTFVRNASNLAGDFNDTISSIRVEPAGREMDGRPYGR
jgi:hypothetical protein